MKFSFEAKINKAGINPYVDVPFPVSAKMQPSKGYIPIKGKIKDHLFRQTLVHLKNTGYRLYVNGPMLKGSDTKVGDHVIFIIEQDHEPRIEPMPVSLKKKLKEEHLLIEFEKLTAGRQKEILRYLNFLKTKEAVTRNIDKVISQLKKKE